MNHLSIREIFKPDNSLTKHRKSQTQKFYQETLIWKKFVDFPNFTYLREKDKNLYHAMNKGIAIASGTHVLFINAGDEFIYSTELIQVLASIPCTNGFLGNIRRRSSNSSDSYYVVKPSYFLNWTLRHGIRPANHQATIYPSVFLRSYNYDIELGLFADQISILKLLNTQPVQISRKIVVTTFQNGGLGDNQSRGIFFRQMFKFNFRCGTNLQRLKLILEMPIILFAKAITSFLLRIRNLFLL